MAKNTNSCRLVHRNKTIGVMCRNGHCYDEDCKTCQDWVPDHWHNMDGSMTARAIEQEAAWKRKRDLNL